MGYKLSDIVNELLVELGEGQSNKFARFFQMGVACLREQNMDLSGVPKVVELDLNSNDTVDIPSDYLNYTRIALCGSDGQLHSLGRNENMCLDKAYTDCGVPSYCNSQSDADTAISTGSWVGWSSSYLGDNIRNGEVMGRFFGVGGGNNANGYYRFDTRSGQILFGGLAAGTDSVVLEYLCDIEAQDGDFEVHPFLIETVKNWMYWKYIARNSSRNGSEKQQAMIDYEKSERLSRMRFNSRTSEEWLAAFRHGNQAAVKW